MRCKLALSLKERDYFLYNEDNVQYKMDLYHQQLKEERKQKFKEQEKELNDKNKKGGKKK